MRFPVSKLEKAATFVDLQYVYDESGMDNHVEAIIFVNAIQGCEYISRKDLVVLGDNDWYLNAEGQDTLRRKAEEVGIAALVFYNTAVEEIPERILSIGRQYAVPIIAAGEETRRYTYSEISDYFNENYYIQTSDKFVSKDQLLKRFYQCSAEDDKIRCIMDKLWCFTGLDVYVNYRGESVRFGKKEHIQKVLDAQDRWERIEPTGLIKEERIDSYYLETGGDEYYFLVSGFDSDSLDDYFLLISHNKTLDSQDTKIFFYSLLALDLDIKKKQADFAERHLEIIQMFQSGAEDIVHIQNVLERYNFSISERNMVILFGLRIEKMDVGKLFYDLLALLKQKKIEDGMPLIGNLDGQLLVMLPVQTEESIDSKRIAAMVEKYASGNERGIGGSAELEEWNGFRRTVDQSKKALFWAQKCQKRDILSYSELGVLKYISREGFQLFSADEGESSIGKVIAYDQENNTELYNTLKAFIRNLGSTSKASKILYISINAVKYRIAQIEKLLQTDLSQVKKRTLIEVEMQMQDMMEQ